MPGLRPEAIRARSCEKPSRPPPTSSTRLISAPPKSWSYLKHDPPERPAFDLVSQRFRCVLKSEGPRHDRFNRSRFEQRTNCFPGCPPHLGRLCKKRETLYAGALPDEIGNVDGRFTAGRDVVEAFGNQTQIFPAHSKILAVGPVFGNTVR